MKGIRLEQSVHLTNTMNFNIMWVIGFMAILNAVLEVNGQICNKDWTLYGDTYYLSVMETQTFQDAKENCRLIGARLTMPKTAGQNNFLRDVTCLPLLGLHRYWIGMTDLSKENAFKWEDGTFLDWGNERWAPGEPNNKYEQDCVAFIVTPDQDRNGKWSTERCSSQLVSFCSKPLVLPKLSQAPVAQDIGTTSFQLTWRCWTNIEDQGDGPVLGYHIGLNKGQDLTDSDWRTVGFVLDGDPCEFLVEQLHINTRYYAAVSILHGDSRREGPRGPTVYVRTHDVELPVLLEPPEVTDVGTSYVSITWARWTGKFGEGDGPIAGYNVKVKYETTWKTLVSVAAIAVDLDFNVTGLEPASTYQVMLTVVYQDGREGLPGKIMYVSTVPTGDQPIHSVPSDKHQDCISQNNNCTNWKILFSLLVMLCNIMAISLAMQRWRSRQH